MKTLNLAHRGFSGQYPENTRRAFLAAADAGCDGFESDVHLSSDGEPVIIHDADLDRTTDGKGPVASRRFSELRELDAGSWKGREYAGEKILHLDEILEIVLERALVLNLELKNDEIFYPGLEEKVIDRVKALGAGASVFLSSFNHISMKKCKEMEPSLKTGLLYGYPMIAAADYAQRCGVDALHPGIRCLKYSPDLVNAAHKNGLGIYVWTVNTEDDMRFCLDRGTDGIITNYPDRLAALSAH
jgi:glycerophosphoryl diester phosphodiesterase